MTTNLKTPAELAPGVIALTGHAERDLRKLHLATLVGLERRSGEATTMTHIRVYEEVIRLREEALHHK